MFRTLLSLFLSLLIVSAASFAVAQDEAAKDGVKPRAESSRADQDRPRDRVNPDAQRGEQDRPRDAGPRDAGPRDAGPRDGTPGPGGLGPRGPREGQGPRGPRDAGAPRGPFGPRGDFVPGGPGPHAQSLESRNQHRMTVHMLLDQLRAEGAEPDLIAQVERIYIDSERRMNDMMSQMGPHPGPGYPREGNVAEREMREREMREHEAREQEERRRVTRERLERLHQAAEHLRVAGLGDLSDRVMENIHELERQVDEPPSQHRQQPEFGELQDQINDLRRGMQELREQLQQLRRDR